MTRRHPTHRFPPGFWGLIVSISGTIQPQKPWWDDAAPEADDVKDHL